MINFSKKQVFFRIRKTRNAACTVTWEVVFLASHHFFLPFFCVMASANHRHSPFSLARRTFILRGGNGGYVARAASATSVLFINHKNADARRREKPSEGGHAYPCRWRPSRDQIIVHPCKRSSLASACSAASFSSPRSKAHRRASRIFEFLRRPRRRWLNFRSRQNYWQPAFPTTIYLRAQCMETMWTFLKRAFISVCKARRVVSRIRMYRYFTWH